jgi:hypothetical protein
VLNPKYEARPPSDLDVTRKQLKDPLQSSRKTEVKLLKFP